MALLFYATNDEEDELKSSASSKLAPWVAHKTDDGRSFILGTNDESGFIGGAICAERSAMVQLRFVPNVRVTKLVIATDSKDPITPGVLCREFLMGHDSVPWDLEVVTSGSTCTRCGNKDNDIIFMEGNRETMVAKCKDSENGEHSIHGIHTTLRDLYPYPSPYLRLNADQSVNLGEAYSARASQDLESLEQADSKRLLELAIMEATSNASKLHPIQFGAAVIFDDGTIVTSHQSAALEYGCTLGAVSQLAPHLQEGPRPLLLVQADQYGIAHAPFAPARAFLTEHGFGDCILVVHDVAPQDCNGDFTNIDKWTLKEVSVNDLQPHAPSWTEGTERTNNTTTTPKVPPTN